MTKTFAPRVSKKEREHIDLSGKGSSVTNALFRLNDQKLLEGARLQNVKLKDITVRRQVRTYFNDESIKELSENIRENGLIQPLVLHRENHQFVLVCGERRFRAITLIPEMLEAPCYILENKTGEELMAIQFSENSSRENLHYIDQADSIFDYQKVTGASERKIMTALGISKTEVHRSLIIAKLPQVLKNAAKKFDLEKYLLIEWDRIPDKVLQQKCVELINKGEMTKRSQLHVFLKANAPDIFKLKNATFSSDISAT